MSEFTPVVKISDDNVVRIYFDANNPDVCGAEQATNPETGEAFASKAEAQAWADALLAPGPDVAPPDVLTVEPLAVTDTPEA